LSQAVGVLRQSVDDVLAREVALARVVGVLAGPIGQRWPALSNIVMSQPLANTAGYIQPVSQRDRGAFERRTGIRLVESPMPGVLRPAGRAPLHLVLSASRQAGTGPTTLGLDFGANPLRRKLLMAAARTGRQLATPPVEFLGHLPGRGVAVYVAVRDRHGRRTGWITASYRARKLASTVTERIPGMRLTIRDGGQTLVSDSRTAGAPNGSIAVAGRHWSVWAEVPIAGISAIPWLVLSLGLAITAAVVLILRQAATRTRYSTQQLALRDAEEAALGQIATLVAQGATPRAVFTSVAEEVVKLCDSRTGAVSRFDAASGQGQGAGRLGARRAGPHGRDLCPRRSHRLGRGLQDRAGGTNRGRISEQRRPDPRADVRARRKGRSRRADRRRPASCGEHSAGPTETGRFLSAWS